MFNVVPYGTYISFTIIRALSKQVQYIQYLIPSKINNHESCEYLRNHIFYNFHVLNFFAIEYPQGYVQLS
jgi:hypothetical protein